MNPRRLNNLVNVLRERTRRSESGEELSLGFQPRHRKVPAEKLDVAGGETQRGMKVEATVDAVFTLRWMADVLETDRLECDGLQYAIKSALNLDGKKQWLTIQATAVK